MRNIADELAARRIVAFEDVFAAGHIDAMHTHDHAQLAFSLSGVMSLKTDEATYILPPNRAIWMPARTPHEAACRGEMRFQVVYIDESFDRGPRKCRVFETSPLVRGLIHEATQFDMASSIGPREARLVEVLLDEIERMPDLEVRAIMPEDIRLRRVCDMIIASPGDCRDIDEWAKLAGMGRRTFTRHFRLETGMGLGTWRQQVRLMEAVSRLSLGEPITSVAFEVGYESPSAFAAMFQKAFGVPPREYRSAG